jgi:hypothetical protein
VTSIDPSDQQLSLPRVATARAAVFFAGNGGRLLLLAGGGFLAVRLALALLHLS